MYQYYISQQWYLLTLNRLLLEISCKKGFKFIVLELILDSLSFDTNATEILYNDIFKLKGIPKLWFEGYYNKNKNYLGQYGYHT